MSKCFLRRASSRRELFVVSMVLMLPHWLLAATVPGYEEDIAPLLTKYCGGCHTEGEANAELSFDSWSELLAGSENGAVVVPGKAAESKLIRVITGNAEPKMPPEGEAGPTEAEVDLLRDWISGGAKGPDGDAPSITPRMPDLPASARPEPVTALAFSHDGRWLLAGSHRQVKLIRVADRRVARIWDDLPGKVESVAFSADDRWALAGSGVAGVSGTAVVWNVEDGLEVVRVSDHRDMVYSAVVSDDQRYLATAGYDRNIFIYQTDQMTTPLHQITEHNGPVYELVFSPDNKNLISASDDSTLKVWDVERGVRLDTRGEPLKEQYTCAVDPAGRVFVGAGADNRIRVWQLVSREHSAINPMVHARFAHEDAIQIVRFSDDGKHLLSVANDRLVKLWDTRNFQQVFVWPQEPEPVLAADVSSRAEHVVLARADGQLNWRKLPELPQVGIDSQHPPAPELTVPEASSEPQRFAESEPNDTPDEAMAVQVPAHMQGVISGPSNRPDVASNRPDVDFYRFHSRANEAWVIETRAAQDKSPLDSHIEVLTAEGNRIVRVRLQAVRDSYFTFRGKDSWQNGDFRLHNWEEMQLNQLLYCNGEVVKLYHYPRGPDSGFNVYPNFGNRHGMFDTTPTVHALQEPCYIVEPLPPDATPVPNGLPLFPVYFENDDDALRQLGSDSRLTFVAPREADYLLRVSDVRGHGGDEFRYQATIRRPQPRFTVRVTEGENPVIGPGRGRKFVVEVDRIDGFDAPVELRAVHLPDGLFTEQPLVVQRGHHRAWGIVWASTDDPPRNLDQEIELIPSALVGDQRVELAPIRLGKAQWQGEAKLRTELLADGGAGEQKEGFPVIEIEPGTTTTARIRIERHGHQGPVSYGKEDAGLNAPHGVFVSNIGLNGVLLPDGENERTIFLTAEPWVEPVERIMFLEAEQAGNATSTPVWIRVK